MMLISGDTLTSHDFIGWHMAIRLDSMLKAVEFPARVADLTASLPDVDRDAPEKNN